jgi:hypothetical protein
VHLVTFLFAIFYCHASVMLGKPFQCARMVRIHVAIDDLWSTPRFQRI